MVATFGNSEWVTQSEGAVQSWYFSNPPRVLDLDDRQGLIASSAMQLKKKSRRVRFSPRALHPVQA